MLILDSDAQYAWPPQDPSRLPNPPPPPSHASAFVYGDNGFNPALRPSNTATRRRPVERRYEDGDGWISGEGEEDEGSVGSRGSSPEPYLSDYDDENWGPKLAGEEHDEQLRRMEGRTRRGSEGWEVRPSVAAWNMPSEGFGREGPGPAWLEQGRYNVYEPTYDESSDSE